MFLFYIVVAFVVLTILAMIVELFWPDNSDQEGT